MGSQTPEAIAKWAEQQASPAHTAKYSRLTRDDLDVLLAMKKAGKTQVEIAQALGCTQGTVSKWITALTDSTDLAKEYLRGKALHMAKNVVKTGQARDHIAALKGVGVLADDPTQGLVIQIGIKDSDVTFASGAQALSCGLHKPSSASGSDNNELC